jgi:hypothetical protein
METLREMQSIFALNVSKLIGYIYSHGYECTFGDAFRSPEAAKIEAEEGKGIVRSLHCERLAVDLNIFRDGTYLENGSDFKDIGEYWKSLNTSNRWGGDFITRPDGNHFSMTDGSGRA